MADSRRRRSSGGESRGEWMDRYDTGDDFDYYDILRVPRSASQDEIKREYRELSRVYHPDKALLQSASSSSDSVGTTPAVQQLQYSASGYLTVQDTVQDQDDRRGSKTSSAFLKLNRAYRVLSDPLLRQFYDRYGAVGVKLVEEAKDELRAEEEEQLHEEGGEHDEHHHDTSSPLLDTQQVPDAEIDEWSAAYARRDSSSLVRASNPMHEFEKRVNRLMRKHEELSALRLMNLAGHFTLATLTELFDPTANFLFRRKWKLQFAAMGQSVQFNLGAHTLVLACAAHIQSTTAGVARFSGLWSVPLGSDMDLRVSLATSGTSLIQTIDASLSRKLDDNLTLSQKVSVNRRGQLSTTLAMAQSMGEGLDGILSWKIGEGHGVSARWLWTKDKLSLRTDVSVSEDDVSVSGKAKYDIDESASVALMPQLSISQGISTECVVSFRPSFVDELTKMQYGVLWRPNAFSLKFRIVRAGMSFTFPIQLFQSSELDLLQLQLVGYFLLLGAIPPAAYLTIKHAHKYAKKKRVGRHLTEALANLRVALGELRSRAYRSLVRDPLRPAQHQQSSITAGIREAFGAFMAAVSSALKDEELADGAKVVSQMDGDATTVPDESRLSEATKQELQRARDDRSLQYRASEESRDRERSRSGLVIEAGRYGHPKLLRQDPPSSLFIVDVTVPLMHQVRESRLELSCAPKAQLVGFANPCADLNGVQPQLYIRYRYGGQVFHRVFLDRDGVLLP
ncbi:unnamed protein product [Vitrella brassicaformis CCMP3155]|uniref:J domain-containing protein n=2 Tax=Vitrella brassicaformis TaxID=1169539 RepID=A0A0G4FE29_VITBC|nr:unnamed protein product [Vitrella brassicaformis CCMP3155]|mmetsp:Transcript_1310/g.3405  ORF Transcript_1310/g.3405 Transcript_1310/m.3405 type:complete len:736 (-) Transcript_1310:2014-4221(-)|eukprot:CEM11220.1 unnamed protein product [Vitrella brassicaformis CCMP3155]